MGVIERLKGCNFNIISKVEKIIFKDRKQNKNEKPIAYDYEELS